VLAIYVSIFGMLKGKIVPVLNKGKDIPVTGHGRP
jgi:hypothetical protein